MYYHPDPLTVIGWMAWPAIQYSGTAGYMVDGTAGYIVAQPAIWWHSRLYGGWHSRLYGGTAGYMVVAHEILVSAQGPFLGFWVWGFWVWGLGLTIKHSVHFLLKSKRRQCQWNISHKLCQAASPGPPHSYLHQNKQFIEFLLLNGEW